MKVFNLPDLGEGLPDAEIVEWLVEEGDAVELDQPLVSMETAKAVVEVPSPFAGKVAKLHGRDGDVIQTGAPLAEFQVDGEDHDADDGGAASASGSDAEQVEEPSGASEGIGSDDIEDDEVDLSAYAKEGSSDASDEPTSGSTEDPKATAAAGSRNGETEENGEDGQDQDREDTGTVVGNVRSSNEVLSERASLVGGVKMTPAVRALARKLKVEVGSISPTGLDGVVTAGDVRKAAENPSSQKAPSSGQQSQSAAGATAKPSRSEPMPPSGDWEQVKGTRRTMARVMSQSHQSVVPTTLMDDADIHAWQAGEDITARLLRALWSGAQAEPGLNAWFDGDNSMRMIHKNMHVGMAVDTPDGLFVAALRNVNTADRSQLRKEINRLRENASNRSIPPEDLKDYTIVLSNFGKFAGRYATPIITPPCVAIVAAGALRHEVVPVLGGIEVHRMIPLSLTFDHRACTGGEAARFLKAMLDDLSSAE